MQYVLGLAALFIALLAVTAAQVALAIGVMFYMHKRLRPKLTATQYGQFDFDNIEKAASQDFAVRLVIVFGTVTVGLHILEYMLVYREILRYGGLVTFVMFILETAGIAAGLYYMFHLDRFRLAVVTGASAFFYLIFFSLLKWSGLLI